jgi:hypothetical protein
MIYSDGTIHPTKACVNSPVYLQFVKEWLDTVAEMGGKTVFWDEPYMPMKKADGTDGFNYCCTCPECQKKFAERYNKKMPVLLDDDTSKFRLESNAEFFKEITDYAASLGLVNTACVMLGDNHGISLDSIDTICGIPHLDNIGSDPYWVSSGRRGIEVYEYVYEKTKKNVEIADRFGKDHNIWIQGYNFPKGTEDDIILACHAAYDAGARTILGWGINGCESNDYRSENPERTWNKMVDGMRRIKQIEYDRLVSEAQARFKK